jgi:cytochrome b involved in lipid metabolism
MQKIIYIIIGFLVVGGGVFMWMQNEDKKMAEEISKMEAPKEQIENAVVATTSKYSLAELSQHSTRDNCWIGIEGKVYNVTTFIDKHPGGDKILQGCGKDSTALFNKIKAHAKQSVQALKEKFYIGEIKN